MTDQAINKVYYMYKSMCALFRIKVHNILVYNFWIVRGCHEVLSMYSRQTSYFEKSNILFLMIENGYLFSVKDYLFLWLKVCLFLQFFSTLIILFFWHWISHLTECLYIKLIKDKTLEKGDFLSFLFFNCKGKNLKMLLALMHKKRNYLTRGVLNLKQYQHGVQKMELLLSIP